MKICFFTENFHKGGLDTFLINLVNNWPAADDSIFLMCNMGHPGIESIESEVGSSCKVLTYQRLFLSKLSKGFSPLWRGKNIFIQKCFGLAYRALQYPVLFPWYVISLWLEFRRLQFDRLMVVNGGYPASLLCRAACVAWKIYKPRNPAVFNFHNSSQKAAWYFLAPEFIIDKLVLWSSSKIVSVSNNCIQSISNRPAFNGSDKLRFISNGISDPRVKMAGDKIVKKSEPPYCIMLATYEPRKGHAYLLRSFETVSKRYPLFQLHIYGYGSDTDFSRISNIIDELNLQKQVKLNGFVAGPENLIAGASLMLVPSQAFESFGLTIIEAMALSVPVIATDIGGMPEVIGSSGAGLICDHKDPQSFANAILKVLDNPTLAKEMGINGRKEYETKYMASEMAAKYHSLIAA